MKDVLVLSGVSYNTMSYLDECPQPVSQTVFSGDWHETIGSTGTGKALNLSKLGFDVVHYGVTSMITMAKTQTTMSLSKPPTVILVCLLGRNRLILDGTKSA